MTAGTLFHTETGRRLEAGAKILKITGSLRTFVERKKSSCGVTTILHSGRVCALEEQYIMDGSHAELDEDSYGE